MNKRDTFWPKSSHSSDYYLCCYSKMTNSTDQTLVPCYNLQEEGDLSSSFFPFSIRAKRSVWHTLFWPLRRRHLRNIGFLHRKEPSRLVQVSTGNQRRCFHQLRPRFVIALAKMVQVQPGPIVQVQLGPAQSNAHWLLLRLTWRSAEAPSIDFHHLDCL
jgi:hypothetical protein